MKDDERRGHWIRVRERLFTAKIMLSGLEVMIEQADAEASNVGSIDTLEMNVLIASLKEALNDEWRTVCGIVQQ
jgi:hypothetical protein